MLAPRTSAIICNMYAILVILTVGCFVGLVIFL